MRLLPSLNLAKLAVEMQLDARCGWHMMRHGQNFCWILEKNTGLYDDIVMVYFDKNPGKKQSWKINFPEKNIVSHTAMFTKKNENETHLVRSRNGLKSLFYNMKKFGLIEYISNIRNEFIVNSEYNKNINEEFAGFELEKMISYDAQQLNRIMISEIKNRIKSVA
jgi:hypothetical protein